MLDWIKERRKLVVFAVGFALSGLNEIGVSAIVDIDGATNTIITSVIGFLTLFAAERIPNQPINNRGGS
jgi:hypothetical protein